MLKTAVLLSVDNLYFAIRSKYNERKLKIEAYIKALENTGHIITYRFAYSKQKESECPAFLTMLRNNKFECHFGNTSWSIPMALRVADVINNIDALVLGSNIIDLGRILAWAKEHGKITKCFALNIPTFFKQFADCIEIDEGLLT